MTLSIHLITDNCPPVQINRALTFLGRAHPPYSVIGGGAAFDVTMQTVERARAISPTTRVILRKLEDTGVWDRMTPEQWFNDRVAPIVEWCRKNEIIYLTDNESSGNDDTIRHYAQWQADVMTRLHMVGLHAAVCAFATGNIGESQYSLLKPVYDTMQAGDVWASHEYVNAPGKSSAGHVNRYALAHQAAGRSLPTVITETGIAVDYNPGNGYHTLGMNAADYVKYMAGFDKDWYAPKNVTVCLFCTGGYSWPTFQIGDDVFNELEKLPVIAPPAPPPVVPASDYGIPIEKRIIIDLERVNLRTSPVGEIVTHLHTGQIFNVYPVSVHVGDYDWYQIENTFGAKFWLAKTEHVTFEDIAPPSDNGALRKALEEKIRLATVDIQDALKELEVLE